MGHGHVVPNADGSKARCGGPALCADCSREKAIFESIDPNNLTAEQKELMKRSMLIRFDVGELIELLTCITVLNEREKAPELTALAKKIKGCLGELSYGLPMELPK